MAFPRIGPHIAVMALLWLGMTEAALSQSSMFKAMPQDAWSLVMSADGIVVGGNPKAPVAVQVIFDVNCPYCAKLYAELQRAGKTIAIRWVPVAYFKPDSGALAAAMLASKNPQNNLETNFSHYDFTVRHGGFRPSTSEPRRELNATHLKLNRYWVSWGGYTPMILVRTTDGRVWQTGGSTAAITQAVLEQAEPVPTPYSPAKAGPMTGRH